MESFFYLILAILGLGFLVFIHELGHYYMALRVGMRVEAFGIGFGKAIYSWTNKEGVEWRLNWLPFGGYVKIAGMESEGGKEPSEIPDGFFGKSPIDRIKVAFMGPLVNLVFALLAFTVLWAMGGRDKNFSEFTDRVGWVDPQSALYEEGLRPGDRILSYDDRPVTAVHDHLHAAMMNDGDVTVKGVHFNRESGEEEEFSYTIKPYSHPGSVNKEILTTGVLSSASYLMVREPGKEESAIYQGAPIEEAGVRVDDRLVWADGELLFTVQQLEAILNEGKALLTVERDGETLLVRTPRVKIEELRLTHEEKTEVTDWQFEAQLRDEKLNKLFFLPYNIKSSCVVEGRTRFIDKEIEEKFFPGDTDSLLLGDRIVAVDGTPVNRAFQLMKLLQERRVHLMVARDAGDDQKVLWTEADKQFEQSVDWASIFALASKVGIDDSVREKGNILLLNPVVPKSQLDFERSPEAQAKVDALYAEQEEMVEAKVSDPEKRRQVLESLEKGRERMILGVPLKDRKVIYNPEPLALFYSVHKQVVTTLQSLFSGALNLKWLSGPVGIVSVVKEQSMLGLAEALFWFGMISVNLGMVNLLPIPVLDGGHICISLFEMVTKKKLSAKTMERLIVPFAMALIALIIFLTYHDLTRLFM